MPVPYPPGTCRTPLPYPWPPLPQPVPTWKAKVLPQRLTPSAKSTDWSREMMSGWQAAMRSSRPPEPEGRGRQRRGGGQNSDTVLTREAKHLGVGCTRDAPRWPPSTVRGGRRGSGVASVGMCVALRE